MAHWQGFYSASQVARLAGVPPATLYDWRRRGIVRPSLQLKEGDTVEEEGYSYADLTLIRILRALRERSLDFKEAGIALRHLYGRLGPPGQGWANERVYVLGSKIYVDRPDEWEVTDATRFGQKLSPLFGDLFEELRDLEDGASIVVPLQFRRDIQIDPDVMGGEPVIKGTRLTTSVVAIMLGKYKSIEKLVQLYKPIAREKLEQAVNYERFLDHTLAAA